MCPITSDNPTMPRRTQSTSRPCAHCNRPCALNYTFCYQCASSLPDTLRSRLTRTYSSNGAAWRKQQHSDVIWDARKYLDAEDRAAHLWSEARAGKSWAIDELMNRELLDHDGLMEIYRNLGEARKQR